MIRNITSLKLGDICEFAYGDGLPAQQRNGGDVPVYGSNGIVGWHDHPLTNGPTIIIGRKRSIGEVHLSPKSCWPIDTTYYVDCTKTTTLSVFHRKWSTVPQFQATRGTLAMLAQWVALAYREGYTYRRDEPLITLGSAPLQSNEFRGVVIGSTISPTPRATSPVAICTS